MLWDPYLAYFNTTVRMTLWKKTKLSSLKFMKSLKTTHGRNNQPMQFLIIKQWLKIAIITVLMDLWMWKSVNVETTKLIWEITHKHVINVSDLILTTLWPKLSKWRSNVRRLKCLTVFYRLWNLLRLVWLTKQPRSVLISAISLLTLD